MPQGLIENARRLDGDVEGVLVVAVVERHLAGTELKVIDAHELVFEPGAMARFVRDFDEALFTHHVVLNSSWSRLGIVTESRPHP